MVETIVLIITSLLFLLVIAIVSRAMIKKQSIIGCPPIPLFYFILAKILALINLIFLSLRGINISVDRLFLPVGFIDVIALAFLIMGTIVVFLSTIQLNNDLIFGLSSSGNHRLQTKGVYSLSRHPFYLGFLFILFSSCLLNPHILNIVSFVGAWIIHHFIMVKEEDFLNTQYGEEYKRYAKKVKRYITL